jgi:Tfp pilus assembly protein PilX
MLYLHLLRYSLISVFQMPHPIAHPKSQCRTAGFALVIALSLMAFVLLLLLSITTLVQVETRSAKIHINTVEAKQHALLGLQMALGELQTSMGPDQRVSATAEILSNSNANRKNTVGVWSSADVSSQSLKKGDLVAWLTSDARDANGVLQVNYNASSAPTSTSNNNIVLVGAGSLTDRNQPGTPDDLNDQIIINISNNTIEKKGNMTGRYGWWIGDEGVKARVNLSPKDTTGFTPNQLKNSGILATNSFEIADPTVLNNLGVLTKFTEEAQKALHPTDLDLFTGSNQGITKEYFHSLTTTSAGVLADVKNGGLKKDLSLAFEMSDLDFNNSALAANGDSTINAPGFGNVQPIFHVPLPTGNDDAHGPAWHLLRDYYRLYHKMITPMTNPTLNARVFGPNLNHGDPALRSPTNLSGTPTLIDQQPAVVMAGGQTKFFNYSSGNLTATPMIRHAGSIIGDAYRDDHPDHSLVAIDFRMYPSDPLRLGIPGDPLRGGGQSEGGTTMPVMVTANYMPYMLRFIGETGVWFNEKNPMATYGGRFNGTPMYAINIVNRERFIFHNPYNVTIQHTDIAIDSSAFDIGFGLKDSAGNDYEMYNYNGNEPDNLTKNSGGMPGREKSIFMHNAFRQARVQQGTFAPGEIKTFAASGYNFGSPQSYAQEGVDPEWHHFKFNNLNGNTNSIFELPTNAANAYTLKTTGSHLHPGNTTSPHHNNHNYSMTCNLFVTHLKQNGNAADNGTFIQDLWPMASVIDTALLLPGQDDTGGGDRPASQSRFYNFPNDYTANEIGLTPTLISTADSRSMAQPIVTVDMQLTPAEYPTNRYPAFARSNPLAPVRDSKNLLPPDDFLDNTTGFSKLSPDTSIEIRDSGSLGLTGSFNFWGPTDGSSGGVRNPVAIELPTSPIVSIGKLQHANLSVHAHMPALAVGNSLASIYIDPTTTISTQDNYYLNERVFYDLSYHMNEALWDRYYFSGLSIPYNAGADDYDENSDSAAATFDNAFVNKSQPLPNPRISVSLDSEDINAVRRKLFSSNKIEPLGYGRAAENLMVEGSFNVNSTSIDAWSAVLSGARDYAIYLSGDMNATAPTSGRTPFSRFSQPVSAEWDDASDSEEAWSGFRALSENKIEILATEIVAELKRRVATNTYPYLSLADFVNRELTGTDTGRSGILQAAIDRADLNANIKSGNSDIPEASLDDAGTGRFPFPENILQADGSDSSASMSAPTYLMQADILQAIGSFISVRSDTFRIRSYGESLNPLTNEVVSQVWLEAIVQRLPEPVESISGSTSDNADYWSTDLANGDPSPRGRRFKVISIRQLSKDEV